MSKIKVHYNENTGEIKGYYPDSIVYKSIPEPFIEIDVKDQITDRKMCVINKIYKEYKKSDAELVDEKKAILKSARKIYLNDKDKLWIRQLRENIPVPQEVIDKSNLARAEINEIEACQTLQELNNYSQEF